ncbi:hypothetical protein [Leptodesmis sichuanensis]|uniref:hypothetical protein n=1 Tax=Leptodesmis sichuanensis TaxID=2906798 RepID=UPI001F2F2404
MKPERWSEYLFWAGDAFRLATVIAQPQPQIHTHSWEAVIPALKNIVAAAQQVREESYEK